MRKNRRYLWLPPILLLALGGFCLRGFAPPQSAGRNETPPPSPDALRLVSAQPAGGDPRAFEVVARMSRSDGGPILGAFEIYVDLYDPATGRPLLQRQCLSTLEDAPDGRSTLVTLKDSLPALPGRPVKAVLSIRNRWVPPAERKQWQLWQLAGSWLPHPRPQTEPAAPLTCSLNLPIPSARSQPRESSPLARPHAVRTLLWRTPAPYRLALGR